MRYLLSLFCESAYEGILIADIEVKVRSDECLANAQQLCGARIHILIMILPEISGQI